MPVFVQTSFAKGEVSSELYGRVDADIYTSAVKTGKNMMFRTYGGAENRPGLQFLGFARNMDKPSRLRRFKFNTTDAYMLEFSENLMRVIRADALVLEPAKTVTAAAYGLQTTLTVAGHGYANEDDVALSGGEKSLDGRTFRVRDVTTNTFKLVDIMTDLWVQTPTGAFSGGTVARIYSLATPYVQADLEKLSFVQSADVMTITCQGYDIRRLTRTASDAWTLTIPTFAPALSAPTGGVATPNTVGTTPADYVVTASAVDTLEESLPSASIHTSTGAEAADTTITWTALAGAAKYSVYKAKNGIYGFLGDTPDLTFTDKNLAPAFSTTPPQAVNPFAGAGNEPATSSYYEQRQVFGGSINKPDTSFYTQIGNYNNMNVSQPIQATDAITATLNSREVNEIRHFVPANDLLVLTSGAEWRVNAGAAGNGFTPTSITQKPQSEWGCSTMEPLIIGNTVLFTTENKITVRGIGYTYVSDSYQSTDLTLLASHLFEVYPLVDWALQKSPDTFVLGVRSDGAATCLTFQQEQQVVAWAPWYTQGRFESIDIVKALANSTDESAYYCVRRIINGREVRFLEKLHSRRFTDVRDCFFVDAGLSFDNPKAITAVIPASPLLLRIPAHGLATGDEVDVFDIEWVPSVDDEGTETQPDYINRGRFIITVVDANTLTLNGEDGSFPGAPIYISGGTVRKTTSVVRGMDHLEGMQVTALADGNVVSGLVVTGGEVVFSRPYSRIHIGLSYTSDLATLSLDIPGWGAKRMGYGQQWLKKISYLTVRMLKSRGLFVGPDEGNLIEMKQREFEDLGDPTALLTGDKIITLASTAETQGSIFMRQKYPLPFTILGVWPDYEAQEGGG